MVAFVPRPNGNHVFSRYPCDAVEKTSIRSHTLQLKQPDITILTTRYDYSYRSATKQSADAFIIFYAYKLEISVA